MNRSTITLSNSRYCVLKEASAQRDTSIGQILDKSLQFYGIRTREDAQALVQRVRIFSNLDEEQGLALVDKEVEAVAKHSMVCKLFFMFPPVIVNTTFIVAGLLKTCAESPVICILNSIFAAILSFGI